MSFPPILAIFLFGFPNMLKSIDKIKPNIYPAGEKKKLKMKEHPFIGMLSQDTRSVEEVMKDLRRHRYDDI